MTTRIKEFVQANQWLIRIAKDAFDSECLVVETLAAISKVDIIPGINLFKEGDTWYVDDFSERVSMPINEATAFFKEKANTLKTKKRFNGGKA